MWFQTLCWYIIYQNKVNVNLLARVLPSLFPILFNPSFCMMKLPPMNPLDATASIRPIQKSWTAGAGAAVVVMLPAIVVVMLSAIVVVMLLAIVVFRVSLIPNGSRVVVMVASPTSKRKDVDCVIKYCLAVSYNRHYFHFTSTWCALVIKSRSQLNNLYLSCQLNDCK